MWKLIEITAGGILGALFLICPPCSGKTPETTGIQFGYENYCNELEAGKRIKVTIPVQTDPNLEGYLAEEEVLTGKFPGEEHSYKMSDEVLEAIQKEFGAV